MKLEKSAGESWEKHFLLIIGKGKVPPIRFLEAMQLFCHHEEGKFVKREETGRD